MSQTDWVVSVSVETLTTLLQDAGFRVNHHEQNGLVQLLSASQGLAFSVRLGNPGAAPGEFLDFTYSCALRIQGELAPNLVNQWNASRRFCRLSVQADFLVLEQDVIVADGISQQHLLGSVVVWDRLLQALTVYLRDFTATAEPTQQVSA
ncbi:YbjN domain-containing protein [Pseudomonas sp. 5P_3.1_Bac2]|uniref:YbjN domain-containing protein n=1 Tax=Pseudomonas sp. 5P_3.1_Bac2 TaxID=2971617 RepID=UPI0021CAB560|nr:YbjN domain-containing protein [Pseudomonas sp. 5P_3.1_Bac2]MCU1717245.1 YbjN domain-containing protein [Pseudomonas sp. 5P_3.1_Bac2]